jgi:hypothetical protein
VVSSTTADLFAVWAFSPSDGWAVGENGTILRWNGVAWFPVQSGTARYFYSLWGDTSGVYASGNNGTIMRHP